MIYKKWYSSQKLIKVYGYVLFKIKVNGKKEKNDVKVGFGKMKIKTWNVCFFKCLLNLRAHALQLELSKVSLSSNEEKHILFL